MSTLNQKKSTKGKKSMKFPHVFTILLIIIVCVGILTYIVPAGSFEKIEVEGRMVSNPDNFMFIDQTPVSPFDWIVAIPEGFVAGARIIVIIILAVAGLGMYTETGVLQRTFSQLVKSTKTNKKNTIVIIGVMLFFYLRGGLTGAVDSPVAFMPIVMGLIVAMGYDAMAGFGIVAINALVGFSLGPTNPYTVGVAQTISELPLYSGVEYRTICWLIFMAITMWYILRYISKIKNNPESSLSKEVDLSEFEHKDDELAEMSGKDKILIAIFFIQIVFTVCASIFLKFNLTKICGLYILAGILVGIIYGYDDKQIAQIFIKNGKKMMFGVFCVAIARAIPIILVKGNIIDTIVFYTANILKPLPSSVNAIGMLFAQTIINFFINSGSGQAAATMPIMTPLADLVGVSRQTAVLAFQMGDGLSNMIFPTSGSLLALVAVAKVNYTKVIKFVLPLFLILNVVGAILLVIATMIGY